MTIERGSVAAAVDYCQVMERLIKGLWEEQVGQIAMNDQLIEEVASLNENVKLRDDEIARLHFDNKQLKTTLAQTTQAWQKMIKDFDLYRSKYEPVL